MSCDYNPRREEVEQHPAFYETDEEEFEDDETEREFEPEDEDPVAVSKPFKTD